MSQGFPVSQKAAMMRVLSEEMRVLFYQRMFLTARVSLFFDELDLMTDGLIEPWLFNVRDVLNHRINMIYAVARDVLHLELIQVAATNATALPPIPPNYSWLRNGPIVPISMSRQLRPQSNIAGAGHSANSFVGSSGTAGKATAKPTTSSGRSVSSNSHSKLVKKPMVVRPPSHPPRK
jgi:hypothetical protein